MSALERNPQVPALTPQKVLMITRGLKANPQPSPPLATPQWLQSRRTGVHLQTRDLPGASLVLCEAVWSQAYLHFTCLPVYPANWLLWLLLPLFLMRITELGYFCGGFPTGCNCKLMEDRANPFLSTCLLGVCPQSGF